MMMTRFVLTLLIGLVVSLGAAPSYAMVCEKYAGFRDFSERVVFDENELKSFKAKGESKSLYYQKGSYIETHGRFQLLPNGKMIRGGYNEIARYKCDHTVDEVLAKNRTEMSNDRLCAEATLNGNWRSTTGSSAYLVALAKRRGLNCGVGETTQTVDASFSTASNLSKWSDNDICVKAVEYARRSGTRFKYWASGQGIQKYVNEAKKRKIDCGISQSGNGSLEYFAGTENSFICKWAGQRYPLYDKEELDFIIKSRQLNCGVGEATSSTQTASVQVPKAKPKVTSAALTASQNEAERLRQELAKIKAQQKQQQQTISSDTQKPTIQIAGTASNGPQGTIKGFVRDNTGIAEVRVDGQLVNVDSFGNFMANTYVPEGGVSVSIQAVDLAGLSSSMSVRLDRSASNTVASISFERLNPLGRKVAKNKDALALIIGVDGYSKTPARAIYADSDAMVFYY